MAELLFVSNFMFKKYVLEHKKVVKKFGRKGKRE